MNKVKREDYKNIADEWVHLLLYDYVIAKRNDVLVTFYELFTIDFQRTIDLFILFYEDMNEWKVCLHVLFKHLIKLNICIVEGKGSVLALVLLR